MADEPHVIRAINWREVFPFTNIFRSFRVAVHPSKLVLGLLAVLTLYVGGRVLDAVWPARQSGVPNEIYYYEALDDLNTPLPPSDDAAFDALLEGERKAATPSFAKFRTDARANIESQYENALVDRRIHNSDDKPINHDQAKEAAKSGKYLGKVKDQFVKRRDETAGYYNDRYNAQTAKENDGVVAKTGAAWDAYIHTNQDAEKMRQVAREQADDALSGLPNNATDDQKAAIRKTRDDQIKAIDDQVSKAKQTRDDAIKNAREAYTSSIKDAKEDEKKKDEDRRESESKTAREDYNNQTKELYLSASVAYHNAARIEGMQLFEQFMDYEAARVNDVVRAVLANNWLGGFADSGTAPARVRENGVVVNVVRFLTVAPGWAMKHHTVYFILGAILFLAVWSLFGGAIARIAAVHVACEEKISVRQALRFSAGKMLSFVFAPVIPLIIVLAVGVVVAIGGLLTNIPVVGPILVGLVFFLALAAGVVMTLILIGGVAGFNLMYPTIAVEGSDSFDAISRSFSYIYARPWRMLFYTVVSIAYGALCYLFVRIFIFLTLKLTHAFAGWMIFAHADSRQNLWDVMWPDPSFWKLPYDIDFMTLGGAQWIGTAFLAFWIYLMIGLLGAFLISFYFSANTVIYYLMRHEVDATELDDVYIESPEEEFQSTGANVPATTAPATDTPAALATDTAPAPVEPASMPEAPPTGSAPADTPPSGGN